MCSHSVYNYSHAVLINHSREFTYEAIPISFNTRSLICNGSSCFLSYWEGNYLMRNISRHIGTLTVLKRLPSSLNGNPRYLMDIAGVTCCTAVDSSYGYCVTNFDGKQVEATIGSHYNTATLNSLKGV